jgi:CheY-like chemotaxis protein
VRLQIKDQGRGISESRLSHIFEPFFSDRQEGIGLGLAAVSGIVSSHGGGLIVDTKVAVGSTFSLFLPTAPAPLGQPKDAIAQVKPNRTKKKLVVADDEELVLRTVSRLVQSLGFDVVCVADGLQAVNAVVAEPEICGVIMDVSMPVMDGYQALKEIRTRYAQLPVLLISGYSGAFPAEHRNDEFTELLTKPFSIDRLKEKLSGMGC